MSVNISLKNTSDIRFLGHTGEDAGGSGISITQPIVLEGNCYCEIYKDGCLLLRQDILYHDTYHIGNALHLFAIQDMQAAVVIEDDIYHPELGRLAKLQGADLLIHVASKRSKLHGAWNLAQSNCLYVLSRQEKLMLYQPVSLSADKSGIEEIVAYKSLQRADLERAYAEFPIFDSLHPAWYLAELTT